MVFLDVLLTTTNFTLGLSFESAIAESVVRSHASFPLLWVPIGPRTFRSIAALSTLLVVFTLGVVAFTERALGISKYL